MSALHLNITISDVTICNHVTQLLDYLETSGQLRHAISRYETRVLVHPTPEASVGHLKQHFESSECYAAVVISDLLEETIGAKMQSTGEPSSWAKDLRDSFHFEPFAMIAISGHRRIPDIDRTIHPECTSSDLLETLKLTTDKLAYLTPPKEQHLHNPVVIREIRANETEMKKYFRLRHRVYKVMGYLEEEVEDTGSRLEIDWCDTTALHIGAFEFDGAREKLIGTARVMYASSSAGSINPYVMALANPDPLLCRKMQTDPMPVGLPIFQSMRSHRMNELLVDTMTTDKNVGELSRVIVLDDYRGAGVANLLIKFAVFRANRLGVDPLLLECLQLHEHMYNKFGFERIEGESGRVIGVQQSMIAMELHPVTTQCFIAGAEIVAERASLCACEFRECYTDRYQLFGRRCCPLRHAR